MSASSTPPPRPPAHAEIDAGDTRRMAPTYIAVIVVEVIVLLAVWWFQEYFR